LCRGETNHSLTHTLLCWHISYTLFIYSSPRSDSTTVSDDQEGNPVGELQELTQKKLWPPPVYEFTTEQGPPHAREFVCTIRLFNLQEQAVGKSKKLAKRNAAKAMLQLIKQGVAQPQPEVDQNEEFDEDSIPLVSLLCSWYVLLCHWWVCCAVGMSFCATGESVVQLVSPSVPLVSPLYNWWVLL